MCPLHFDVIESMKKKKNRIIVTFSLFSSARWPGSVLCVILNVQRYKRRFDNSYHCMLTVIGCHTKSDVIVVVTILCDSKIKLQDWFVCVVANVDNESPLTFHVSLYKRKPTPNPVQIIHVLKPFWDE